MLPRGSAACILKRREDPGLGRERILAGVRAMLALLTLSLLDSVDELPALTVITWDFDKRIFVGH